MTAPSLAARRAGWTLSALAIAFLLLDAAMKLVPLASVTDTMRALGWPTDPALLRLLGAITIAATVLYAIPRTAAVGAILLTAYLGGAVATHVRIGSPLFTHILFGVYVGAIVWAGLLLRDPAARAIVTGERSY